MMPSVVAITLGGWAGVSTVTFQAVAHRQLDTTTSQSLREDYVVETQRTAFEKIAGLIIWENVYEN
jgi:hypothetical protein